MHLIYLDESGNTGTNLSDPQQPVFVLAALIVPEVVWLNLEKRLVESIQHYFPERPHDFEVHANELLNPRGFFRAFPMDHRLDFYRSWLSIAASLQLRLVSRAIVKKRYAAWLLDTYGPGVVINPHNVAFVLTAQVVNEFLRAVSGSPLGILISDENHEVMPDIEKSIRLLRGEEGSLRLSQIVEKGFFIESQKSHILQLCDLCAYAIRRAEEQKIGHPVKPAEAAIIPLVDPLRHTAGEPMLDVLAWLDAQQKKERPGR
jgi:hypothetical protein